MVNEVAIVMGPAVVGFGLLWISDLLKGPDAQGSRFFIMATGVLGLIASLFVSADFATAGAVKNTLMALVGWLALLWCVFLALIAVMFFKNAVLKTSQGYSKLPH